MGEFLAINPMHNVPTMVVGDFTLNESRAIATYLVTQYGKDSTLLPGDVKTRAVVDQRMYFDMGTFYKAFGDVIYPTMFGGPTPGDKEKNRLAEVLGWMGDWVKDGKFVAGTDNITLGDISCLATFSSILACGLFDGAKFPNLLGWFDKCKAAIPNYEKMNKEAATQLDFYKSKPQPNFHFFPIDSKVYIFTPEFLMGCSVYTTKLSIIIINNK